MNRQMNACRLQMGEGGVERWIDVRMNVGNDLNERINELTDGWNDGQMNDEQEMVFNKTDTKLNVFMDVCMDDYIIHCKQMATQILQPFYLLWGETKLQRKHNRLRIILV